MMYFKRLIAIIMIAIDSSLLDHAVHPFNPSVGPGRVGFSQVMFTTRLPTDPIKNRLECIDIFPTVGELDPVIGQYGMNLVRNALHKVFYNSAPCLFPAMVCNSV